jgi:hypothetical protein
VLGSRWKDFLKGWLVMLDGFEVFLLEGWSRLHNPFLRLALSLLVLTFLAEAGYHVLAMLLWIRRRQIQ